MPQKGIWGSNPQLSARNGEVAELVEGGGLENRFAAQAVTGVRIPTSPPDTMNIELENINNARDLGGMQAADGQKIKPKRLIRSSALCDASESDINTLVKDYKLSHVVDFRTEAERCEKPHLLDKFIGVKYSFLESFDKIEEVVTRDKESNYMLIKKVDKLTEEAAIDIIEDFYDQLPTVASLQIAYKMFFKILLENKDGAVLWHCSLGKDRAGIAAVLIEHVLGVSKEDIYKDYMLTNENLDQSITKNKNNAFRVFYGVRESFLDAWYQSVEDHYGNVDNYLNKKLGVGKKEIIKLRAMYLE